MIAIIVGVACLIVGVFLGAVAERVVMGYEIPKGEDEYF